jgi:nucleoid-associated protein YgaU
MPIRSGIIVLIALILTAGCSPNEDQYGPQSLKNLPYRPLKNLIPAEDTWYDPKHTDVINPRNQQSGSSSQANISEKEHWGQMAHRLQRADSLYSLARQYYGDADHWRLILAANRHELPNAHQLPLGNFIYLPMTPLKNPDGSFRTPGRRPDYYIIGSGDTLAQVARTFLGKTEDYQRLAQFNHLPDPDQIKAGQLIALPREN